MSSSRHAKRDREKAKREKAVVKRERRDLRRADAETDGDTDADAGGAAQRPQAEVLQALAALHTALDDEQISFDDFESAKADLLAQLQI